MDRQEYEQIKCRADRATELVALMDYLDKEIVKLEQARTIHNNHRQPHAKNRLSFHTKLCIPFSSGMVNSSPYDEHQMNSDAVKQFLPKGLNADEVMFDILSGPILETLKTWRSNLEIELAKL